MRLRVLVLVLLMMVLCVVSAFAAPKWEGTFNREGTIFNSAKLKIPYANENHLEFVIEAVYGAHDGKVSGIAKIERNTATFDDGNGFSLKFTFDKNGKVHIVQNGFGYGGTGVGFGGDYSKGNVTLRKVTFADHEILTPTQEEIFIKIVGSHYDTFTDTLHIAYEENDLDGFGSKVHRVGVRGLFGYMECIIMVRDSDNAMWAAVIDNDRTLYFTNTNYTKQLPITIAKWNNTRHKRPVYHIPPKS